MTHSDQPDDHHHHDVEHLQCALLTISSSRSLEEDTAGEAARNAIERAGHSIVGREVVSDDPTMIRDRIDGWLAADGIDLVVTFGGTGITPDDVTPEAVRPLFDRELPGFGERFRARSVDQIGERVIASRAVAGVADGVLVFCVPGSEAAARLAVNELILEVGSHLSGLATRGA